MEEMIAYCGIICSKCPVFKATQADDDEAREEVAKLWSKQFGIDMKPQDAYCDGCLRINGRLIGHCRVCGIRACGMERKVETCAACNDFACEKLQAFHKMAPHARKMLEKMRVR